MINHQERKYKKKYKKIKSTSKMKASRGMYPLDRGVLNIGPNQGPKLTKPRKHGVSTVGGVDNMLLDQRPNVHQGGAES